MKPAAQLQASIELLEHVTESGSPADRVMARYFRSHRYIGAKDKAVISEHLYSVLRQRLSFEYLLEQAGLPVYSRFLMAVMLRQQEREPADFFNGERHSPQSFSAQAIKQLAQIDFDSLDSAPLNVQLNVPAWLAAGLQDSLGERYADEMKASNQRAHTDIRVNLLKASREQVNHILAEAGFAVQNTSLSPWGIRFTGRVALFGLDSFKQGWFEVQDEGSQLLALVSQAKAGDKVVDFCAGAGGKTLALAAMMENKGVIHACDVHTKRLQQMALRAKRAGAHNIRSHVLSSEHDKWVKQHRATADVVLVDAPCSGTGTWRRSPDSRWNLSPENLENLVKLQQSILRSASRLVKPGGRLLYASCSLLNEENEEQIANFLAAEDQFELAALPLPESISDNLDQVDFGQHQLRTYPALSGTDGFYVCALVRKGGTFN